MASANAYEDGQEDRPSRSLFEFPEDLDDWPVDPATVQQDLGPAQKAVVIHRAEQWPSGPYCLNDRAPFPCRLRRWGERVLLVAGWSREDIAELDRRAAAGEVPWP